MDGYFKYILLLTIFLSSALTGMRFASNEKNKLKINEGFLSLVLHVKRSVEYYSATLDEIYKSFSNSALEEIGFLPMLIEFTSSGKFSSFCHALEGCKKRLFLDEEVYSVLYSFGKSLGNCCREEQIDSCSAVAELLEERCGYLKQDLPKKIKLHTTLGISCGMMLVIVLI